MFPIMVNTMAGFRSTDPDQIALVRWRKAPGKRRRLR